jgi:hypothetical protein
MAATRQQCPGDSNLVSTCLQAGCRRVKAVRLLTASNLNAKGGETQLAQRKHLSTLGFCLLLVTALIAGAVAAGRTISLTSDRDGVVNSGSQTITFTWNIAFDTSCTSAQIQIIGPAPTNPVVLTHPISCGASPIAGSFGWTVPLNQSPGVYTAVLTFNSHWAGDTSCCARDYTDTATLQFSVCCQSQVTFCKFLDVNGNGTRDPSDPALGGWSFTVLTQTANCATPGTVVAMGVTDPTTGCVTLTVPMNPCDAATTSYCVQEAPPVGDTRPWLRTTPSPGSFATLFPITVTSCGTQTVQVGNWCPGTLQLCKFADLNGNGTQDPGDPVLGGWTFTVMTSTTNCATAGTVVATAVTDSITGCTPVLTLPVNPVTGTQSYCIAEAPPAGDTRPWLRTTPTPGPFATLFPVTIQGCGSPTTTVHVGNWVPVTITGFKFEDLAPWPWTSPPYVGPEGQHNDPLWEPVPDCTNSTIPVQTDPTTMQPSPGIPNVTIGLYDASGTTQILPPVVTDANGHFVFGPFHFGSLAAQTFTLKELDVPAIPPSCDPNALDPVRPADLPQPYPWPGVFEPTVAQSIWPCPNVDFANPTELQIDLPVPAVANFVYGYNYFYNRQPGRLWGQICQETIDLQNSSSPPLPNRLIGIDKIVDATAEPFPSPNTNWDSTNGIYVVPELPQEPLPANNNRHGIFRLTPAAPSDPTTYTWAYRVFCAGGGSIPDFTPLPSSGYVDVSVPPGRDVRVDFCLQRTPNKRLCFLPVTFTQDGWHNFANTDNTIVTGGMVYNRFPLAFANYTFYSTLYHNVVIIGQGSKTMTWEGTSVGLKRLALFMPQTGACGKLDTSYVNAWTLPAGVGGSLAGELLALQMNIAYNDRRVMPRTSGYDLELFTIASGIYKGKTVREVRNIANLVLSGQPPCQYGLTDCAQLVGILAAINANYEFVNFDIFNDRGFLVPNRVFGQPDPAVPVVVP